MIFLGYYLHDLSPYLIRIYDRFGLQWYGLSYLLGFYLTFLVVRMLSRRGLTQLKEAELGDFIIYTAMFGAVLGGRVGFIILYSWEEFIRNPLLLFKVWEGGMASHGGIAGVAIYLWYYARKNRISWVGIGDTLVCGAPLGILTGRIANFINGELFGRITQVPWAVKFPTELHHLDFFENGGQLPSIEGKSIQLPQHLIHSNEIIQFYEQNGISREQLAESLFSRHPSQLYEGLGEGLFLSLLLLTLRLKFRHLPNGILTGLFFLVYALVRILLENVRQPDSGAHEIMGFTKGQFYSVFMILIGVSFLVYGWTRRPSNHFNLVRVKNQ
jgi:phosphatidylglycerol:prolipoprotein diacylglycerol transferase